VPLAVPAVCEASDLLRSEHYVWPVCVQTGNAAEGGLVLSGEARLPDLRSGDLPSTAIVPVIEIRGTIHG
jgi:hypothetical protein